MHRDLGSLFNKVFIKHHAYKSVLGAKIKLRHQNTEAHDGHVIHVGEDETNDGISDLSHPLSPHELEKERHEVLQFLGESVTEQQYTETSLSSSKDLDRASADLIPLLLGEAEDHNTFASAMHNTLVEDCDRCGWIECQRVDRSNFGGVDAATGDDLRKTSMKKMFPSAMV